jgi:hypothetical protein
MPDFMINYHQKIDENDQIDLTILAISQYYLLFSNG